MIALDYALSDERNTRAPVTNWLTADDVALRYYLFRGDQIIIINGVDFSARWGWVPLLDFAAALVEGGCRTHEALTALGLYGVRRGT